MKKIFTLCFLLALVCVKGWGQAVVTQTTPGTYSFTVPTGITSITVECWGGGGAGGGVSSANGVGGGGGGGAYARSILTVTPGTVYSYTVGAGGVGTTGGGINGTASSFNINTIVADYGRGGVANTGALGAAGTATASTGTNKFSGGTGGNGSVSSTYSGAGGGGAGSAASGGNASGTTRGNGGSPDGGNGGSGLTTNGSGNSGNSPGGGGGGAKTGPGGTVRSGGNGGSGRVRITYTVANDDCSTAITVTSGSSCSSTSGSLAGATQSSFGGYDVWYKFVADGSSKYTIRVVPTSANGFDPVVELYTSCGATSSTYLSDNNGGDDAEAISTKVLTAGTYYYRIYDYNDNTDGIFTTCIISGTPANDLCANVITLPFNTPTAGTTANGTVSQSSSKTSDVWYKFIPCSSTVTVSTSTSNQDLDLYVFEATSCPSITASTAATETEGDLSSASTGSFSVTVGVTYYIRVALSQYGIFGSTYGSIPGDFTINVASSGTVTQPTISLSSGTGSNIQSPCINTAITPITYNVGNSSSTIVTGLPSGVTGTLNGAGTVFTISGTPTAAGTFGYTVTTSNSCATPVSATGTITVKPNASIVLSSAAGTNSQTPCINTAITPVTYTIGGGGTGAGVVFSPAISGVTGAYSNGVFTISGTPTVAGTFNYTVTTTGTCTQTSATGTITVKPNANAGTVSGISPLCIGTTASYTSNGTTGGTWTSTNTAVATVNASTGAVTAVAAGLTNITYTVSSGCNSPVSAFKTVTVSLDATAGTITGTSPLCIGVTSTYTSNGNTGGTWSSSNTNVATVNASSGAVTTISAGTATIRYTVSAGCNAPVNASKTLTVNPLTVITGNPSDATYCQNATATALSVAASGTGTLTYQWYSNTTKSSSGGTLVSTSGTYTPSTATAGTFYYYVTVTGGCGSQTSTVATVTVNPTLDASIASAPAAVCFGAGAGVNVFSATGGTLNYTTQVVPGGTIVPHTATLTANSTSTLNDRLEANTTVTLVSVTNATGCSYSLGNSTATIMVNPLPTVAAINGPALIANGATVTYTDATTGGNWSSTYPGIANVISQNNTISRARVNGVSVGTATITYTVGPDGNGCTNVAELPIQVYDNMLTRYRTTGSGNFSSSNWEKTVDNGNTWTPSAAPDGNNTNIEIRDIVTLDVDYTGTENASLRLTERNGTDAVLKIAPTHILSSLGGVDFNGKSVIVQSDVTGSGTIGQMTSNINNADNVTVERYTDGGYATKGKRAWRLMTSPVTGQTIRDAWQDGGANSSTTSYGTLITGEGLDANTAAAQGYDYIGAGNHTSIKHYAGGAWLPLSSDNSTTGTNVSVRTEQAYMVFVRGNRSVKASGESVANLRAKGTIFQGDQMVDIGTGAYTVVGNPYASSLDFESIHQNNSAAIKDQFYLWNSTYGTYGAYVLVTRDGRNGGYQATPSLTSGVPVQDDDAYRYIPSGSGFFVSPEPNATSTTVTIREQDKAAGNTPPVSPFRVVTNATDLRYLVVNLNQKNSDSSSILADGFRAKFSPDYEGNEEDNSAAKPTNFNENLGLVRNGINHIIEAHGDVKKTDTLQLKMWNVSYRDYQFQMKGDNFTSAPGIKAWLEDSYLQTKQAVDLTGNVTTVDFTINKDSGSWKSTRFRIVFENNAVVLPVTITKVSANPKNGGAEVNWTVSNEVNVKGYTVEKSLDGRTFTTLGTQQPAKNNPQSALTSYFGYDAQPEVGDNYYRIRIEGKDGSISYSSVVKVTIGNTGTGIQITLYPNPVREGKTNLNLTNLKEGAYLVSVFSGSGQTVYQKKVYITLAGTTQTEPLLLGNRLAQGSYQMRVADSNGKVVFTDKLIVGR